MNSSAARKAYGVPEGENSVNEPRAVVLWELAEESVSLRLAIDRLLEKEDAGEERELERSRLAMEGVLEDEGVWEDCELEKDDVVELDDVCERDTVLGEGDDSGILSRVMIFMPLLVLVLAGMKSVVCWFGAGMDIRLGWLELAQGHVS